jgi:Ca2+-binding RTX toxin-like protein
MKRTVISVLTVAALLVALSGAALATTTAIVNGTAAGDHIKGTARADTIHGRGGNDAIRGMGGDDLLYGDDGHDTLTGGSGDNVIRAGDGMRDRIVCGNNSWNFIYYDPGVDRFDNCVFKKGDKERRGGGSSTTAVAFGPGREAK